MVEKAANFGAVSCCGFAQSQRLGMNVSQFNATNSSLCEFFRSNLTLECNFTTDFGNPAPTSLDIVHLTMIGIFSIFFVLMIIPTILVARHQPQRSRGLLLFLVIAIQIVRLAFEDATFIFRMLGIYQVTKIKASDVYLDIGVEFFSALTVSVLFASQFHLIRYLVSIAVNEKKIALSVKKSVASKCEVFVYRIFQSAWPYIFLIFAVIIVYIAILFGINIGMVGSEFNCPIERALSFKGSARYVSYLFLLIMIISFFATLSFDIVTSCIKSRGKCNCKNYFVKHDKFAFRLESFLIVPFQLMILLLVVIMIIADLAFIRFRCYQYFRSNDQWYHVNDFVSFFYSLIFNSQTLFMVVFPNFWTLWRLCRQRLCKKEGKSSLLSDLNTKVMHDLFFEFSKEEWSVENVLCWDDIVEYRKNPSLALAKEIYEKYFTVGALCEVNTTSVLCKAAWAKIEQEMCDETLFDELAKSVQQNMTDTYSRFIYTAEYRAATAAEKTVKDFH